MSGGLTKALAHAKPLGLELPLPPTASSIPLISRVGSVKKSRMRRLCGCITQSKRGKYDEEFATHAKKIAAGIRHDLAIVELAKLTN